MNNGVLTLSGERGAPPHFAGRKAELNHLHERLNHICLEAQAGGTMDAVAEGMVLITGVPGVGKTQLAKKFIADAVRGGREDGVAVAHLNVETPVLEDPVDLLLLLGRALGDEETARKAAGVERRIKDRSVGVGGLLQGRVGYDHARHSGKLGSMLRATAHAGMWRGKALILLIDELQRIDPLGMASLATLHQGDHGCPILVIGAGLQHTQQVLANPGNGVVGISRIETPLGLANLSAAEAEEAIFSGMTAIGRAIDEAFARRIAAGTFGFPQHVNGHLHAARQVYDDAHELEDSDIERVLELGGRFRVDYYRGRLNAMGQDAFFMPSVAAMMEESSGAELRRGDVARMLDELTEQEQGSRRGAAVVDGAIKHGVLTTDFLLGTVWFGIPSFQSYLAGQKRQEP